jgi:2-polyprenyl-3-methyl-5-hydroxy-6-metoxy-1,4-benzoquinol methylase
MSYNRVKSRNNIILASIDLDLQGLEIGPSHNPVAPKKKGFKVKTLDHLSAEELRKKYQGHAVNLNAIEEVDFIWSGEPLSQIVGHERFSWIIASHVIEHVPDFIAFLNECEILLDGKGCLSLAVPDKRYCFDHFREISSLAQIIDANREKRTMPSVGVAADYYLHVIKKGGLIAFDSALKGNFEFIHDLSEAKAAMDSISEGNYLDLHNWVFTPSSFRILIEDLFSDTSGFEFYITLQQNAPGPPFSKMELMMMKDRELALSAAFKNRRW